MPLVKNVWVKIQATGARETKDALADIAAQARELGRMDPTIKVDSDAMRLKLMALRLELDALRQAAGGAGRAAGGIGGFFGRLPPQAQIAAIATALTALPFLAQIAAGAITFVLGGALAGLGIYGAIASSSLGKVHVTALQLTAAQKAVAAAQDKLAAAQKSGADNTGQLDRAYAGLASAQDHLAKVQAAWASQQLPAAAQKMHQAFSTLSSDAQNSLQQIGASFVPVLTLIAKVADVVLKDLTPAFVAAEKVIAPAFSMFGTDFVAAFDQPAVVTSVKAVAAAFSGMLKALSPTLAGDVRAVANGITEIAQAVSKNPGAFAAFISFFFRLVAGALTAIAYLTQVADYIEKHFLPTVRKFGQLSGVTAALKIVLDAIAGAWKLTMDLLQGHWRKAWDDIKAFGIQVWNAIRDNGVRIWHAIDNAIGGILDGMRHHIANIWDGIRHDIAHFIDMIWNNTVDRTVNGIKDVVSWFKGMPGRIVAAVGDLSKILFNAGKAIIDGLWNGLKSAWGSVSGWLSSIGGWISSLKGPLDKDLVLLRPHGKAIMTGLAMGMNDGLPLVQAQIARTTGTITGGGYGAGGGGGALRIQWVGGPSGGLEQALWTWFRERIRVTGGGGPQSVQRALGVVWR